MKTTCKMCSVLLILLFYGSFSFAQYSVKFRLINFSAKHKNDALFIAGSFNNWNPQQDKFRFTQKEDTSLLEVNNLPAATYQYKIARGS